MENQAPYKAGPNRYIVHVESRYNVSKETEHGEWFIDPDWDKEMNTTTHGIVRAIPIKLTSQPTLLADKANNDPKEAHLAKMIPSSRLPMSVKVGDKIHFSYEFNDNDQYTHLIDGEIVISMFADSVLAVERNGQLIPQGGKILLKQVEENKSISNVLITPDSLRKRIKNKYEVVVNGDPLIGDHKLNVKPGTIVYTEIAGEPVDFGKGREYIVNYQRDILCYEEA